MRFIVYNGGAGKGFVLDVVGYTMNQYTTAQSTCSNGSTNKCYAGVYFNYTNYGSQATIDTADPYVAPGTSSFQFVLSFDERPVIGFRGVQTGWGKQNFQNGVCSFGRPVRFFETYSQARTIPYNTICDDSVVLSGENNYYTTLNRSAPNPVNYYWCAGFNGDPCWFYEYDGSVGMTLGGANATRVAAYGEVSGNGSTDMGRVAPGVVYLRNIQFINPATSQFSYITYDGGRQYNTCGITPCPYYYSVEFGSGGIMSVYNYTSRP
jgi:hypothetical protein